MNEHISQKVMEIAQALGDGWIVAAPRAIDHRDGYGLEVLTDSRLKMKDRLIFVGSYGYQGDDLTSYISARQRDSLPTITASLHREAAAIADEIRVRLLPRYLEARVRLLQARQNHQDRLWREQQIALNLRNVLGTRCTRHTGSKVARDYPRRADRRAIEVEAVVEAWHPQAPEMVRVTIAGLSPQEAEELLAWTRKISPSAPAEEG